MRRTGVTGLMVGLMFFVGAPAMASYYDIFLDGFYSDPNY